MLTTLLVLASLLLVGGGITYFATNHGKALLPTLKQPSFTSSHIIREHISGKFLVTLRNHAPLDLRLDSVRYSARVDGKPLAQGHQNRPLVVKGHARSSLSLPLELNLLQLAQQLKTSQRDCVTVELHTILYANLPGVGSQKLPIDVRKRVYIPKLPKIEVADVDITKLGLKKGEAVVTLHVTNYESIAFTVKQVSYRFRVANDLDVKGQETRDVTFKKKGTETMPIHVRFAPKSLPRVLFKTIFRPKPTDYQLTGTVTVAAGPASARDATMQFNSSGTVKDLKELAKGKKDN